MDQLQIHGGGGGGATTDGLISAINVSAGTTSNNLSAITFSNSNGVSFGLDGSTITGSHNAITTGMASNRGSDFVQATAAFAGTSASGTINSTGISVSIGPYITTGALSGDTTKYIQAWELTGNTAGTTSSAQGTKIYFQGGANITLSGSSNTIVVSAGAGGGDAIRGIAAGASTATTNTVNFSNSNGISFGFGAAGNSTVITGSHNAITTGRASTDALGLATAQTNVTWTANSAGVSINAAGYAGTTSGATNATFTLNSLGLNISVAAGGAAGTYTGFYEPFAIQDGTATFTNTLSQLNVQPFSIPVNLSLGQIKMFGNALVSASASNSHSGRLTNSSQRYIFSTRYTIGNTHFVDLFLFSRGSGSFSTELETFASTRNSFITNWVATYWGDATLTNASGGSLRGSQTIQMTVSYPHMTTGQTIDGATSHTTWGSGYTTWASVANNSSSFTFSTSAARTLSIGTTLPATTVWSGGKIINLNFATSLTGPGEYWLGMRRHSSSSASSSSANSFTGAAGTGNSYSATFNSTAYGESRQLTWGGKTYSVVNSLGSLGFASTSPMAIDFGLGSFSGTWDPATTYVNNAGNPAGAIAYTQLRTNVSFFKTWFQMGSNRMM